MNMTWLERLNMLAVKPETATRDEVKKLAMFLIQNATDTTLVEKRVREIARLHLSEKWIDGDNGYLPDIVDIVEKLCWWIEARKREDARDEAPRP